MDFNGDGRRDVISGSYSPGYLFAFLQQPDGSYAASEKIRGTSGKPIKVGAAAHVYAADWDNDRDLDLVVGNISGELYFVRNESTSGEHAFAEPKRLFADDEPIKVGRGDAGPVLADWDSDGLLDLVVGAGDGSVMFFRNSGSKDEPALAAGRTLIEPSQRDNNGSSCGTRTKVCVTDYNEDGQLDLLVGDFASIRQTKERTPEEKAAAEKAQKEYRAVTEEYMEAFQKTDLSKMHAEHRKLQKEPRGETAEEAIAREQQADELMEQIQTITEKELKPFLDRMRELQVRLPNRYTYHGFVWLYLRQPAPAIAAGDSADRSL